MAEKSGKAETDKTRQRARKVRGEPRKGWQKAFLDALSKMANVRAACEVSGVSRAKVYAYRGQSQAFARRWEQALEVAYDRLEQEAWRRAVAGTERPVTVAGQREVIREYSDRMLEVLLKAHRPEKFRERYDVTTRVGESEVDREIRELTDELNRKASKS